MTIKAIINAVKGETWCRLLTTLMRLVVGGLFVFSGFTKAVDPWGTCYKITDYLNAMGMEQWGNTALFLAVALAALEFMVGIAIVVGAYRRSSVVIALLMMAVMTPVTLWLAITDAVPDCGCFGDALHLSNWATFFKNVLLILGLIYLLMFNKSLRGVYGPAVHWMVMAVSFAIVMAVAYYGYFVQPLIDYRPYPGGTRLASMDTAGSDDENSEDDFIFIYSRDGVEQEFTIDSLPDEEDGWEYVTRYHARRPQGKIIIRLCWGLPNTDCWENRLRQPTYSVKSLSARISRLSPWGLVLIIITSWKRITPLQWCLPPLACPSLTGGVALTPSSARNLSSRRHRSNSPTKPSC